MFSNAIKISLNELSVSLTALICSATISIVLFADLNVLSAFDCIFCIESFIDDKDSLVLSASFLTSSATTANPFPASPALAASIAAFKDSKLVCSEILPINLTIFSISFISS